MTIGFRVATRQSTSYKNKLSLKKIGSTTTEELCSHHNPITILLEEFRVSKLGPGVADHLVMQRRGRAGSVTREFAKV